MKRVLALLGVLSLAAMFGVVPVTSAGAIPTTTPVVALFQTIDVPLFAIKGSAEVYVVHGLNLAGQTAQADRGTAVTVCANGAPLLSDLQFGDVAGPVSLLIGSTVAVKVFAGAGVDCASAATPVISQDVTVPDMHAVALVATSGPGPLTPALLPVELNVNPPEFCGNVPVSAPAAPAPIPDDGHMQVAHAAAAGTVSVTLDGTPKGTLAYGETNGQDLAPATYSVEAFLGATPIVGPANVVIDSCVSTIIYVVGNQTLPEAPKNPTTALPAAAAKATTASPEFTG